MQDTTLWVPTDRLVPHPENPNRMTDATFQKLCKNIDEEGRIPPVIVRSLELTARFTGEAQDEMLQILDGEHRWRYCVDRQRKQIEVRIWSGVSDSRALQYLATMNRLQGKDDPKKRQELVRALVNGEYDVEELPDLLPESSEQIQKMLDEHEDSVSNLEKRVTELKHDEPWTIFGPRETIRAVQEIVNQWLEHNDPEQTIADGREAAALLEICRQHADAHDYD